MSWWECEEPWRLEERLIGTFSLPLNLMDNRGHPFHSTLAAIRKAAREKADSLAVLRPFQCGLLVPRGLFSLYVRLLLQRPIEQPPDCRAPSLEAVTESEVIHLLQ